MVSVKNFHHPGDLDPYPATNALSRPHPRSRRASLDSQLTYPWQMMPSCPVAPTRSSAVAKTCRRHVAPAHNSHRVAARP